MLIKTFIYSDIPTSDVAKLTMPYYASATVVPITIDDMMLKKIVLSVNVAVKAPFKSQENCGENFEPNTNNPRITQKELTEITGLSRCGIEWNISQLKTKGLIERIGHDKGGY